MLDVRDDRDLDLEALAQLRARCAFTAKSSEFLAAMIAGSRWIAYALDEGRLVGFARAISDGVATAYFSSVMVDPAYRRRGIGRALVERIMHERGEIKFVLHAREGAAEFYVALGFIPAADMMVRDRR